MLNLYELFSFKQLIEDQTRITLATSSIIDHIATTCARNIVKSGVYETSLSDHYMVHCILKFHGAVVRGHRMIKTQRMKCFDEEAFLANVSGIGWEEVLAGTDSIDVLVKNFSNLFSLIIESHALMTGMSVLEKYCPWVDNDLKKLMQTRDKLKRLQRKETPRFLWIQVDMSVTRSKCLTPYARSSIILKRSLHFKET